MAYNGNDAQTRTFRELLTLASMLGNVIHFAKAERIANSVVSDMFSQILTDKGFTGDAPTLSSAFDTVYVAAVNAGDARGSF